MDDRMTVLEKLAGQGAALARSKSRDDLFLSAVQAARALTGATYTSLGLVEGDVIHWQSAAGKPLDEVRGYKQPVTDGLCGWVVRHGRSRRSGDVTQEPDYFCQYAEMRSELDVPIKAGDNVIGVLSAESPNVDAFTALNEAAMRVLAGFVAIALMQHRAT